MPQFVSIRCSPPNYSYQVRVSRFYQSYFLLLPSSFLLFQLLNCEFQTAVGTAGPQPWAPDLSGQGRMSNRMPGRMSEQMPGRMSEECRRECQNRCQKECQKECQNTCQKVCQNRCQIECQMLVVCQNICQKEGQIECQKKMPCRLPDGVSETLQEECFRAGITWRMRFFFNRGDSPRKE